MLILDDDLPQAVPCPIQQSSQVAVHMPTNFHPDLASVLKDHETLFRCPLGKTDVARHVINTGFINYKQYRQTAPSNGLKIPVQTGTEDFVKLYFND